MHDLICIVTGGLGSIVIKINDRTRVGLIFFENKIKYVYTKHILYTSNTTPTVLF